MLRPCCALALRRGKLGEPLALGAHVACDEKLRIDLIDVLLHASLGQKELFGDLAVAQALGDERGDGAFALGEAREGGGTGAFRTKSSPSGVTVRTNAANFAPAPRVSAVLR